MTLQLQDCCECLTRQLPINLEFEVIIIHASGEFQFTSIYLLCQFVLSVRSFKLPKLLLIGRVSRFGWIFRNFTHHRPFSSFQPHRLCFRNFVTRDITASDPVARGSQSGRPGEKKGREGVKRERKGRRAEGAVISRNFNESRKIALTRAKGARKEREDANAKRSRNFKGSGNFRLNARIPALSRPR